MAVYVSLGIYYNEALEIFWLFMRLNPWGVRSAWILCFTMSVTYSLLLPSTHSQSPFCVFVLYTFSWWGESYCVWLLLKWLIVASRLFEAAMIIFLGEQVLYILYIPIAQMLSHLEMLLPFACMRCWWPDGLVTVNVCAFVWSVSANAWFAVLSWHFL